MYGSLQESLRANNSGNYVIDAALYLDVLSKKQKIIQLEQNILLLTGKNIGTSENTELAGVTEKDLLKLSDGDYLATFGFITKKSSRYAYKLDEFMPRQEVVALATRIGAVQIPDDYECRNVFSDVSSSKPNSWACRTIENAYYNNIISKGQSHF